ncbi:hypothetical protein S7711_00594 [Stachybotrys chartarum IBT 7711]|uniref:EGF-like domain-containing protein n=1 Tax=Stachybotrys chartarum (strain CBS 109288 / IBT 7711) TaxID=1280523 RepID=A0A084ATU2_STACB|nr:hypothetical protein S7711_00594 [Stachybotrys chartarum IBT 7711]
MEPPYTTPGSVKRAREAAQAGLPRIATASPTPDQSAKSSRDAASSRPAGQSSKIPRPRAPPGLDGNIGDAISRPRQIPQWPLAGPVQSPVKPQNASSFRPPAGQAPRRPPRPSLVPSILDQSRLQDPTPVFLSPQSIREPSKESSRDSAQEYLSSVPATPSSRLTTSSVGSIPDFPVPSSATVPVAPRRSTILGPPPSSRRGASSFYSTASFVSPIPEESPNTRSHGSYASSAAMPSQWDPPSPMTSPSSPDVFYEDSITDKSRDSEFDDFGDESNLVRRASLGKKGKPSLIVTKSSSGPVAGQRPSPTPVQPFDGGTTFVDVSTSSSNTLPTRFQEPASDSSESFDATADGIIEAYATAAGASGLKGPPQPTSSANPLQRDLRRPPRLDMEAVKEAEARGSLTSLPDLIRRATRLAAMIDGGKRPASRFEDLRDYLGGEKTGGYPLEKDTSSSTDERYRSGLSDMLAAFPPPAQAQANRTSWFRTTSWPLAPDRRGAPPAPPIPVAVPRALPDGSVPSEDGEKKKGRRCCGLPRWAFIMIVILSVLIIATAIVIPLQFFVFGTLGSQANADGSLENCRSSLVCQNGGTNVISQGVCSCICTNGFSGPVCTVARSDACTTTNLVGSDGSTTINDVTLGRAIPRLIAQSNANFSIPLSGTTILSKLNAENLSCIAQNSLVTFNGQSTRAGAVDAVLVDDALGNNVEGPVASFITLVPGQSLTLTISRETSAIPTQLPSSTTSEATTTTSLPETTSFSAPPVATSAPATGFSISQEILDFARVSVLFVLQQETADDAVTAQTSLQRFFTRVSQRRFGDNTALDDASNLNIGGDNFIDLISLTINLGNGPVGRTNGKRAVNIPISVGPRHTKHSEGPAASKRSLCGHARI